VLFYQKQDIKHQHVEDVIVKILEVMEVKIMVIYLKNHYCFLINNQKKMSVSNQIYSSSLGGGNPLKNLLATEGEKLIGGAKLCEELWEEMRRADFRKEGILNEANIQIIYENKKKIINNLLKITSVKEFILVFDEDQDGFLNEDEQILVFTIIAKRIQVIAEELCQNKKYELFKDLMKEVRARKSNK